MTTDDLKAVARREQLSWLDLRDAYHHVRFQQRERRAWKWTIRDAFLCRTGYRHLGHYKAAFRRAFTDGDHDRIAGFDVLAQSLAAEHPELAQDQDPAARLWELVCEPIDRMPPPRDSVAKAVDLLTSGRFAVHEGGANDVDEDF
ncbi:MAG: hypothetical protein JW809_19370 [Pirellulales bacterium]|nr:hypothetical protein [Pirellulales bacterium]